MAKECTIKEVAERAGVGVATVSRVYNNKEGVSDALRERVLRAGAELGYTANVVARTRNQVTTKTIAFVATSIGRITFSDIVKGVNDVIQSRGYRLHVLETNYRLADEMEIVESLASNWVDGIILTSAVDELTDENRRYVHSLSRLYKKGIPIPVVTINHTVPNPKVDAVVVDHEAAAHKAVYHLIEIGKRKIAYISIPTDSVVCSYRIRGYERALRENGLADTSLIRYGGLRVMGGYRAMKALIEERADIDSVFVSSDEMAIGAMRACKECGLRIPEDIPIVSNDDILLSSAIEPPLSTVRLPRYTLGERGAKLLLDRIEHGWTMHPQRIVEELGSELIIRESTLKSARNTLEALGDLY